jgi:hypothetical protein
LENINIGEKEELNNLNSHYLTIGLLVVVFLFFAIGGDGDFSNLITGRVASQNTNASITVTGISPVTILVQNNSLPSSVVTVDGVGTQIFYVVVSDEDGVADINDTSVYANFTRAGQPTRHNSTCTWVADINSTAANFSCSIDVQYFDQQGLWQINASAVDLGNVTRIYQSDADFAVAELKGIEVGVRALTWNSVAPGAFNATSNNDPTVINNTGNFESNITLTAVNLMGESDASVFIDIANLTVANTTSGDTNTTTNFECETNSGLTSNATRMANNTLTHVLNTNLSRGNHSVLDGETGQEQIYFCFPVISSSLSSQVYSTSNSQAWVIGIN